MLATSLLMLIQAGESFTQPTYFGWVVLVLIVAGALGWLVAAVLGFARARAFGSSTKWFAMSAVCLVIFHLHILLVSVSMVRGDNSLPLKIGAFFNLFVALGAVCAIIGFVRLTSPR